MIKNPRGSFGSFFAAVVAVVSVVIVTVGVTLITANPFLGIAAGAAEANLVTCTGAANLGQPLWGCDSNGGATAASSAGSPSGGGVPQLCTSSPNACGMTSNGTRTGSTCSATPPPNSSCPEPTIGGLGSGPGDGFFAEPDLVQTGSPTVLNWQTENTTSCTVSGGPLSSGASTYTGSGSGSVTTGTINASTVYTLTCEDGVGGPQVSATVIVRLIPRYKEI